MSAQHPAPPTKYPYTKPQVVRLGSIKQVVNSNLVGTRVDASGIPGGFVPGDCPNVEVGVCTSS
jgi:hypothetical protein